MFDEGRKDSSTFSSAQTTCNCTQKSLLAVFVDKELTAWLITDYFISHATPRLPVISTVRKLLVIEWNARSCAVQG